MLGLVGALFCWLGWTFGLFVCFLAIDNSYFCESSKVNYCTAHWDAAFALPRAQETKQRKKNRKAGVAPIVAESISAHSANQEKAGSDVSGWVRIDADHDCLDSCCDFGCPLCLLFH